MHQGQTFLDVEESYTSMIASGLNRIVVVYDGWVILDVGTLMGNSCGGLGKINPSSVLCCVGVFRNRDGAQRGNL